MPSPSLMINKVSSCGSLSTQDNDLAISSSCHTQYSLQDIRIRQEEDKTEKNESDGNQTHFCRWSLEDIYLSLEDQEVYREPLGGSPQSSYSSLGQNRSDPTGSTRSDSSTINRPVRILYGSIEHL
jgi:hypothetical protein